ncbi:MAG TPA: DUF5522 domain-containing protein [Pyrinomonadaceae bacterium]
MSQERSNKDSDSKHDAPQLQQGLDYYLENGFLVFTAHYLSKRGYCCENGCRHCPYGFKKGESEQFGAKSSNIGGPQP